MGSLCDRGARTPGHLSPPSLNLLASENSATTNAAENTTQDVVKSDSNAVDTPAQSEFQPSFTRILWLPEPADGKKASARLSDRILTLRIPKELPGSERIRPICGLGTNSASDSISNYLFQK